VVDERHWCHHVRWLQVRWTASCLWWLHIKGAACAGHGACRARPAHPTPHTPPAPCCCSVLALAMGAMGASNGLGSLWGIQTDPMSKIFGVFSSIGSIW